MKRYNIYPSLLDSYFSYLKAEETYEKYWGSSETPSLSLEEFLALEEQDFFDKINRVKKDRPHADLGTCFNEIVDCINEHRKSETCTIEKQIDERGNTYALKAGLNGREFLFPIEPCLKMANDFKGAMTQVFVEGELETSKGIVRLYGFVDELLPYTVCDIKTTKAYEAFNYKGNNQHLVYPFCLNAMGNAVREFQYNIVLFDHNIKTDCPEEKNIRCTLKGYRTEVYIYNPERDIPIIRERCEELIDFLEANNHRITSRKIFNEV